MTPAARAAHLRLLSTLPCRTHEWQRPKHIQAGMKRTRVERERLRQALLAMHARGATIKEMKAEYSVAGKTIHKLIGREL